MEIPEECTGGDCFQTAFRLAQSNPKYKLVHGMVTGQGKIAGYKYVHAWCEFREMVFDATVATLPYDKEEYYKLGQIENVHEYGSTEIIENAIEHEHYGPWEDELWITL